MRRAKNSSLVSLNPASMHRRHFLITSRFTGTGKAREFFQELHRLGIKPTMIGIEYSREWLESMPKLTKCIEFFNATALELTVPNK